MFRFLSAVTFILLVGFSAKAQAQNPEGVYIIYDSSNSMWAALPDSSRKYEAARIAMRELVGRDFSGREVALRMYGHRRKDDCSDSELVVPFSKPSGVAGDMIKAMESVRPTGRTPIDLSFRQALDDFGERSGSIILISDGIESCDADPCALVQAWRDRNVDIAVHVVGLGLKGKERAAMECIADAAGTEYRDAFSAGELVDSLGAALEITADAGDAPDPGTPAPEPQETVPDFALIVVTDDGARQKGAGTLTSASGDVIEVETFNRFTPEPGEYTLTAGVQVVGGAVYKPVTIPVTVAEHGRTNGIVQAVRPPEVSATFAMEGEELRATVVTVFQDGKKIGSFKGDETAFVPEGILEFHSKLRGTSEPISVTESFVDGDVKTISFEADIEVRLMIKALGTANGIQLKGKPTAELWQNGERKHKVNNSSGGLVTPGTYILRLDDVNVFETEIVVTREPDQVMEIDVPAGGLTVIYQDKAGNELTPERVFIAPEGVRRGKVRSSNQPLILLPGTYTITGFPKDAGFPEQQIVMKAGVEQTLVMRATK